MPENGIGPTRIAVGYITVTAALGASIFAAPQWRAVAWGVAGLLSVGAGLRRTSRIHQSYWWRGSNRIDRLLPLWQAFFAHLLREVGWERSAKEDHFCDDSAPLDTSHDRARVLRGATPTARCSRPRAPGGSTGC